MLTAFAGLLWLIVQPCYDLTGNWWAAILLFTLIIKLLMLPLSLWCQKTDLYRFFGHEIKRFLNSNPVILYPPKKE
ncbi:MAG: hypothetical protein RR323_01650, partial [Raoultibacter sp.]